MKKYFLFFSVALFLSGFVGLAQNDDVLQKEKSRAETDKKISDYDEIIIKKKNPDINEKLVIEIKDDEVIVNGKPIEEFINDAVSVRIHSPKQYNLIAPASPFRFPGSSWSLERGNMYNGSADAFQPFLGVMTEGVPEGTKILTVSENSPAAKAGLKKDDIITRLNGEIVTDHEHLTAFIRDLKPDDKVTITYKRNGKENKTTAVLGKRMMVKSYRGQFHPDIPGVPEAPIPPVPPLPPMEFNFDDLGDHFGRAFNMDRKPRIGIKAQDTEDGKGVKVLGVDDGSAAEKSGLKENDIIISFDGKTVNSAEELADASRGSKDKPSVKVELKRNGKNQEIDLKVPKKLKTATL
jgi:serine protease Do